MVVSAKDLRFKISMLFDVLTKGEEITITYRGKPKAKLVSFEELENDKKIVNIIIKEYNLKT